MGTNFLRFSLVRLWSSRPTLFRKDVKRVVITSSIRCVVGTEPREYTEADWNEAAVTECEEKGKDASGEAKYSASKLLAERGPFTPLSIPTVVAPS